MIDPTQFPAAQSYTAPGITGSFFGQPQIMLPAGQQSQLDPRQFFGMTGAGQANLVPPPELNSAPVSVPPTQLANNDGTPTPPNNPSTNPPSSDNGDFLQTVREVGGNILGGALGALDLPAKIITRPTLELLTEPQVFAQKVNEGGWDIWKDINLLNEAWNENQMPGVFKFAAEMAGDPLTYVSAGGLSAISKAKYVAPILERIPGGVEAASTAVSGLQKYEEGVNSVFSGASNVIRAAGTPLQDLPEGATGIPWVHFIPLETAKNNARGILGKILPGSLVENILNSVPSEYTGIPIGAISNPINEKFPKLGLPTILKAPDVRQLRTTTAFNVTADSLHNALSNRGINIFQPDTTSGIDYGKVLRDIAYNPKQITYTDVFGNVHTDNSEFIASSVLRQPSLLTQRDIGQLNSAKTGVGGLLTSDNVTPYHIFQVNSLVQQYHQGTIDQGTTVQALQQLFGVNAKSQPESGQIFSDFLNRRDLATTTTINDLSKMPPEQMVSSLAGMAKNNANKAFDLKIEAERAANSYMDQFLNKFDNVYTTVYKNTVLRFITEPLSLLYLGFVGYPIGNAVESYARHIVGGGGLDLPIGTDNFNIENGLINTPRELTQTQSRQAFVAKEITARASGTPLDYPTNFVRDKFIQPGSGLEQAIRRHYWNNALQQELGNVWFAKGLGARTDFQQWMQAANPLNVGSDPQLTGLSQDIADSVSRMAVKAVGSGQSAINGVKNSIDVGLINRNKLAADLLDNENAANLNDSSRAIIRQWANSGEMSGAAANDMIESVVDNEKKLVDIAPEVLAQKFQGLSGKIISRAQGQNFGLGDLYQSVNDLRAMYEQYASIPEMLRMREYEALKQNQLKGLDISAVHDEYAKRLKNSMDAVNKAVQPSYTQLIGQADRLGLRAETENYINALRAQQDALAKTWSVDSEFRQNFFASKPDRRLSSTWDDPITGYFPQRQRIWQSFMGEQANLSNAATQARLEMEQGIEAAKIRQQAFQSKMADIAAEASPHISTARDDQIAGGDSQLANQLTYERARRQAPNPEEFDAEQTRLAIERGETAEQIAARIPTDESVANRLSAAESEAKTSGSPSFTKNVRPGQDGANDITGNGPSADSATNVPTSKFITDQYARADSNRSWLTSQIANSFNNPAITDAQKQILDNYVDGIYRVFNSLDQSNRKILNDSMRDAVDRTRQRYYQAYINYDDQTIFDFLAKHIFPFWIYESRRWPYLANIGLKYPGLAAAYNNYMQKTDNGYINIGEIPYDINPLRGTVIGGIDRAVGKDYPPQQTEGLSGALNAIETTLGKFGFYLGPHISIPSQFISGQAGQSLPELFSTVINAGRAADLPGFAGMQQLLPDQYRDYYTRQILASQGLEPDHVYEAAADDPNSAESAALDVAQRQASLVGIVLGQTGVLRFRTQEYQNYLDGRMNAVEKITGISVERQKELQDQGISISQVSTLSPDQRQQLAALPGTQAFSQVSEPLLNPVAQKLRQAQNDFYSTVKDERDRVNAEQTADDQRLASGIISGVEWRKRYQDRSGRVSDLVNDLKKSEAYKNVPITQDEQAAARQRFNLPPLTQSPVDIVLNEYYNVSPETDPVTGDVNWSKFFTDRQNILLKYPAVYDAVKAQIEKNDTPQVRQFRADMELLRPYFGIRDDVIAQNPQFQQETSYLTYLANTNPVEAALYRQNSQTIKIINKVIQQYQDAARKEFPQLDAALVKWYGATPISLQQRQVSFGSGKTNGLFKPAPRLVSMTGGLS